MRKEIKVKSIHDIQKINQIVSNYPFDVWIHSKSGMVDAKSVLGIFALSLNEPLYIVVDDDVDASKMLHNLEDYLEIME